MDIRRISKQTNIDIAGTGDTHLPFPAAASQSKVAFINPENPVSDRPAVRNKRRMAVFFKKNLVDRFLGGPRKTRALLQDPRNNLSDRFQYR